MIIINDAIEKYDYLKNIAYKTLNSISSPAEAQISIIRTTGINISTRYGNLENIEFHNDNILTVTLYLKQNKGHVTSNDFNEKKIPDIISKALNIARYSSPDPCSGLANKSLLAYHNLDLDLFHPFEYNIKDVIDFTAHAENIALKYDKQIIQTEGAIFNSLTITKILANTHGFFQGYHSTQYSLSCGVIAKNNNDTMERNYDYTTNRSMKKLCSSEKIGERCARRTLKKLNPKKIVTIESPILFSAEIAASLFNHLIHAIHGKNVYKKSTFLLNDLGKIIFPNWLCIKERPHVPAEIGSAPFDNEGVKTTDRTIIKNGMLCTWLLDSYSARKLKLHSTGHANNIYNWYVNCNNINLIQLIKKMDRGIIITDLMGQGINIITGDYSRGATGFWVQNGKIKHPVHEITISGNLKDMFLNIISISNDIETRSNIKCGSILISSMMIAGK
ncbi:metalloprotease PmbA [Blochmannia endosymbiont of Polyrhachis (Hedomyrma) turneri]|uniref:metalloprotease PmbA n=1 Tax=Blochmannia endosymbiont of Polyrhachis (Hedomyrma) turneri TaxID=1505596 RepID=UPI00061A82AA|nr:metalloprotease PmbA [Blochmannia endosymbiont of Polyrhachis (Hedomyrma) turneri]AKC59840.1 Protein pmbA [Blochmannia endosymbiont of Polyrhachis (Hedomyrma) turneri]